jgi:predicted enzyme related to lactoylglutathione lyase
MANPFAHIELNTDALDQSKAFYSTVFEWKLQDMPQAGGYTMIDVGKGGVGGGMQLKPMPQAPTAWLPYVTVDDVAATLEKARNAGAQVVQDRMPIGEMGAIGIFIDPAGAALGVWEAAPKPRRPAQKVAKKKPAKKAAGKKAAGKKAAKKKGKR